MDRRSVWLADRALDQRRHAARRLHRGTLPAGAARSFVNEGALLQDGEQVLLIDQRGKRHLIFLRKSETFHSDRGWILHDAIVGQPEGSWIRSSMGLRYLAVRPTLAEYVLEMPRGAQVIYPKDLAMILFWADVYPGCRVLEAGTGSGALTLALLRAVGPEGRVITYEQREEFARRALANIHTRLGDVTTLTVRLRPVEDGIAEEEPVDRVVLDLPEPWKITSAVAARLRPGGIFLSYVPTIIQSNQLVDALQREPHWALIETFETLYRPWNIDGQSVRPFHRMVAHTGFITVARRVMAEEGVPRQRGIERAVRETDR
jgi:tRNA (adenine57-N1/adenine58-N1)-methyltransferase